MPILIDGNNLLHRLPEEKRSRSDVRKLVLEQVRGERISVTVVFDGSPPPGVPKTERLGTVTIVYSGRESADDVIIRLLPNDARSWSVVTDDRGLAAGVRRRGARVRSLARWLERRGAPRRPPRARTPAVRTDVKEWERVFSDEPREEDAPTRVLRRKRRPR